LPGLKKILFISYYWPPSGGAGVQRPLKMVKYLLKSGIEPIVITVDPDQASYTSIDESLLTEVPQNLRIYHTATKEHYRFYKRFVRSTIPAAGFANESNPGLKQKIARFIRGNFYFPDPRKGWKDYAVQKAKELIISEGIDLVFTTSPPHSTHLIGLELRKTMGVKWIAELMDPWVDIYYFREMYPLPFAVRINKKMERTVLENADHIVTCSYNFRDLFLENAPSKKEGDFQVLYLGYDQDNFTELRSVPPQEFVITYNGTVADSYDPHSFFRAVKRIVSEKKIPLKLRFNGIVSSGIKDMISHYGLDENAEYNGLLSHGASLESLMNSTALLLIVPPVAKNEGIIPGKLFEYIASGKPVIALANPDGDVASILNNEGFGKCFAHDDEEGIYRLLNSMADEWKKNKSLDLPNRDISRFSIAHQARLLAEKIVELS
jgi:glycosyltransferase involved in cell wall biosynthesis